MFKKENIIKIIIIAIGYLWCSTLYLAQEQYLLTKMSARSVNIIDMLFASFGMAFGMFIFIFLRKKKKNTQKIYQLFMSLSILLSIIFYLINNSIIEGILLVIICIIGTAGFGVGYHFSLLNPSEHPGKTFAISYSLGAIFTYLIFLLPKNIILSSKILLLIIPLILINMFLVNKYGVIKDQKRNEINKKQITHLSFIILLMAIISSISSNLIASYNITIDTGFAYSRVYYSIGLILAGFLADKKNDYIEVGTIISLFYPLIAILLFKENFSLTIISSLNYLFLGFFSVFRLTSYTQNTNNTFNSTGLLISRIVEGSLVLLTLFIDMNYITLIITITILLALTIIEYLFFYKVNKNDPITELSVKYKLSIQEEKVLELLIQNKTNQEIADELFLSVNTIRNHIASIYKKTNMKKNQIKEFCLKQ